MRQLVVPMVLIASSATAQVSPSPPKVSVADARTLSKVIDLAPPLEHLKRYGKSKILWGANIDLPKGARIEHVDMTNQSMSLTLRNGYCLKIDSPSAEQVATKGDLVPRRCGPGGPVGASPGLPAPPPPKPGLVYAGRAWNLIAWTDPRSGRTMLMPEYGRPPQPVLTTTMRVIAVDGVGSVDTPMTGVSLVGYVHRQLVAVTILLIVP